MTSFGLIPLIIVFPLLGLLINLAWGHFLGEKWVGLIASSASALAFVIAVLQWAGLSANGFQAQTIQLADWLVISDLRVPCLLSVALRVADRTQRP